VFDGGERLGPSDERVNKNTRPGPPWVEGRELGHRAARHVTLDRGEGEVKRTELMAKRAGVPRRAGSGLERGGAPTRS